MNRAERRAREKEKKKEDNKKVEALAWFRALPPTKRVLIDSLVKLKAEENTSNMLEAIYRCLSAALIQNLEDLEVEDINKIIDKCVCLMEEDTKKIKKLKDSLGGSYDMAVKKVNEMGPEVEKRVRELIKDGYNQKVSVKMLIEEFNTLSTAMLTNAYKKTKAIVVEEEKANEVSNKIKDVLGEPDKEVADALEYIFEDEAKENVVVENKAILEEKEDKGISTPKEIEKANTEGNNKAETTVKNNNSKLKVVKEVTKVIERDVQGEYGLYNIKGAVVTVDEEFAFSNIEDVNCWASSEREGLLKQMEEIKAKISHINSCEQEAIEVIETFMNI